MNSKLLILATRNAHKAHEIAQMLPPGYELRTLADFAELPEVEETGRSFAENAALKAKEISARLPGLVLADDSGLCVDALCGAPGILSARFAGEHGDDAANNRKLLRELAALPCEAPYTARFACAMCLARGGEVVGEFMGTVEGHITLCPSGRKGFGYDPLFMPLGWQQTFADMAEEEKNGISHRARALAQVMQALS